MKSLQKGKDKIQHLCDILTKETLEPAQLEAEKIIEDAEIRSQKIISDAKAQAEAILEEGRLKLEAERKVFDSSLLQAAKQSVESLKQIIEQELFHENFDALLIQEFSASKLIAKLIDAVIEGIRKEGVSQDFTVMIPKTVSPEEVGRAVSEETLQILKERPLTIGTFSGGIQVKLLDKKLTLAITDHEIGEFLKRYARKDFRKFIFTNAGG